MFGSKQKIPKTQRRVGITREGREFVENNQDYWTSLLVLARFGDLEERVLVREVTKLNPNADCMRIRKTLKFLEKTKGYVRYGPQFS